MFGRSRNFLEENTDLITGTFLNFYLKDFVDLNMDLSEGWKMREVSWNFWDWNLGFILKFLGCNESKRPLRVLRAHYEMVTTVTVVKFNLPVISDRNGIRVRRYCYVTAVTHRNGKFSKPWRLLSNTYGPSQSCWTGLDESPFFSGPLSSLTQIKPSPNFIKPIILIYPTINVLALTWSKFNPIQN